jgi:outer membrane protein insertion porin family/translocation and assembly module TamA
MRVFVALVLVSALFATPVTAQEPIKVHSLIINGVKSIDVDRLKSGLATRVSSKLPWGKKAYFDRTRFDTDLKRITTFYADRGYPNARVVNFDVQLDSKENSVDLTVTVDEGAPVKVTAVNFVGFQEVPVDHLNDVKARAPIKVGAPRDRQLVVATRDLAVSEVRDHGYPYATVATEETHPNDDPMQSTLTFTASTGKIARFGEVTIVGNQSVSNHIIERQLTFKPGELFRRSLMQDSQRRLYGMELFQFVNIEPENQDQQPDELPMRVTVAEGNHQRVNFGVGYGTEEKARAEAEYHHLNFLGGARSAGVHGRWSSLDRGIRVDFNQPYVFAPQFSLGAEGQYWETVTPAYNSLIQGGKLTLTHRPNARFSWDVSVTGEHDSSSVSEEALNDPTLLKDLIALGLNPITGEQNGTLNAIGFDISQNTADSVLDPKRGSQLAAHVEQAGRILPGTFQYTSVSLEGRHYLPLSGGAMVLASRAQFGNIRPYGDSQANVPFSKRFFLGGATSIRGWGRYEVSPLSGGGTPLGGASMFMFSEELRARVVGNVGGVIFLDAGNVWLNSLSARLDDLRYAIGVGLRYQTPIGPIRLDYGYQLNPIPGLVINGEPETRRWRVHFSIGQAF